MRAASPRRLPGGLPLWVGGNLFVLILWFTDIRNFDHGLIGGKVAWGRDFVNVWTAGKAVLAGQTGLLYELDAYHRFQQTLFGPLGLHNYSYPPLGLPLTVPFAVLPYPLAYAAWILLTSALFLWAARPWWREATTAPLVLVLLTPAALINVWTGHYGFLLGALLLFGWRALESGRPWLAGLCFGLMAIKPHIAILVPLVLLLRGEGRAILAAAATVAVLALATLPLTGLSAWEDYVSVTLGFQASLIDAQGNFFGMMSTSIPTALLAVGASRPVAVAIQIAVAALGIAMVARVARNGRLLDVALLAATATFLVLPYAFNYDLTVSALGAVVLLARGSTGTVDRILAGLGFLAPQLGMALAFANAPVMPLLLLGLAIAQYRAALAAVATSEQAQA